MKTIFSFFNPVAVTVQHILGNSVSATKLERTFCFEKEDDFGQLEGMDLIKLKRPFSIFY